MQATYLVKQWFQVSFSEKLWHPAHEKAEQVVTMGGALPVASKIDLCRELHVLLRYTLEATCYIQQLTWPMRPA